MDKPTVLDMTCPDCGAQDGNPCRQRPRQAVDGHEAPIRKVPHVARQNLWAGYQRGYTDGRNSRDHPNDPGVQALWRGEVARQETILGFSEWLAWREADADDDEVLMATANEFFSS